MMPAGAYAVPEEIRRIARPEDTIIKRQGSRFYVYKQSSSKVKVTLSDGSVKWKTSNNVGKCIGQITEQAGFISNNSTVAQSEVTVLEYGCYEFINKSAQSTLQLLRDHFNRKDADRIYTIAAIFVVEGFSYMKELKDLYEMSYLKRIFPDVHVGYEALHKFYSDLGRRSSLPDSFNKNSWITLHIKLPSMVML